MHFLCLFARPCPVGLHSVYLPLFTYVYPVRLRSYSLMSTLFAYLYHAYFYPARLLLFCLLTTIESEI